jgi:hypothetical protein
VRLVVKTGGVASDHGRPCFGCTVIGDAAPLIVEVVT